MLNKNNLSEYFGGISSCVVLSRIEVSMHVATLISCYGTKQITHSC